MLENQIEDFDNKVNALETKIENNGGKIREQETTAVQSVYIDASQRGEIIRTAGARTAVQQTDGESLHNARIRAMERTEAFLNRKRAVELSNIYYSLFTENPPSIDEARFKQDLLDFVKDVESADKSKWDDGNDANTPAELAEFLGIETSLDENIYDEQGNIEYGKVEEISDGVEQGQQTVGELSVQEERGRSEGGRTNVEASVVLRGDREANQTQYTGEPESVRESQERLLKQYAKEKGLWVKEGALSRRLTGHYQVDRR